jgi:hypothetical protein
MNRVLSLLMAFVFLNATSWAFPPNYAGAANGDSEANLSGVYSGVLVPSGASATATSGALSLGIFALGIPNTTSSTVFAQGAGVLFSNGAGYNLTITGVLDPTTSKLTAIVEGESDFTVTTVFFPPPSTVVGATPPTGIIITSNVQAEGTISATVEASQNNKISVTGPGTAGAAQINGKGDIQTFLTVDSATGAPDITTTITFTVTGFQQSSTFTVPTLTFPTGGTTPP